MLYRSATVFVLSVLAGAIPTDARAQDYGHSPVFNPLASHVGLGQGKLAADLAGKTFTDAAVGRQGGPADLDIVSPRLEVHGAANGKKVRAPGAVSAREVGAASSSKGGSQAKRDIGHLPTCE